MAMMAVWHYSTSSSDTCRHASAFINFELCTSCMCGRSVRVLMSDFDRAKNLLTAWCSGYSVVPHQSEQTIQSGGRRDEMDYSDPAYQLIPSGRRGHDKHEECLHIHPSTNAQSSIVHTFTSLFPGPQRGCARRYIATSTFSPCECEMVALLWQQHL